MKKIIVFHTEKGRSGVVSGGDRREQVRISSPAAVFYSILSSLLPELKRTSGVFTIRESGRTFAMLKRVGILLAAGNWSGFMEIRPTVHTVSAP